MTTDIQSELSAGEKHTGSLLGRLWHEQSGQDLIEYALLIVLIALSCIAAIGQLATGISSVFSNAAANLSTNS